MNQHLLALLVALPLVAAIVAASIPSRLAALVRPFAALVLLAEFGLSLKLLGLTYLPDRPALVETHGWLWDAGISATLAVDGISMPLVLLTTFITPIALFSSFPTQVLRAKPWTAGILLMQAALVGAFLARDLVLFYVFWELVLLPLYLFVSVWGNGGKSFTANKFFLYTLAGSLLMLVAIVYAGVQFAAHSAHPSFLVDDLTRLIMPLPVQALCFAAFATAFLIKMPIFPMHSWSPDTYRDAPLGAVIIASAVMAKLGCYGLLRFAMPMFPLGSQYLGPSIAVLAVVSILYGALAAMRQNDMRVMLAYSSMSHMGFIVFGLFAMTPIAHSGSVLQMVSHGFTIAGMFLVVAILEARTGTRGIDSIAGVASVAPRFATVFVMLSLAAVAIPTTSGFVGETMILSGGLASRAQIGFGEHAPTFAAAASIGIILGAVYILSLVQRAIWGTANERVRGIADLTRGELALTVPLVLGTFILGLAPSLVLERVQPVVTQDLYAFDMRWNAARASTSVQVVAPPERREAAEAGEPADPAPRRAPTPAGGGTTP